MHETLAVKSFSGFAALEQLAEQIDALNRASARPNPYRSADFLRCFSQYNEYGLSSDAIRLYTVWEQNQLIACLPLRWVQDRFGPLRGFRLCFLAPLDIEQFGISSSPDNDVRVAHALIQHLRDKEPRMGMLELVEQRPDSVLYQVLHQAANAQFRVRDIEVLPFNEIPIAWPDMASYFRSLSSSWRSCVVRYARKLLDAGTPEFVFAEGAQATRAWFDAYLDLESRSWKHNTTASLTRNTRRTELFRRVMTGHGGFTPSFIGILIDGVLIAGDLNGSTTDVPANARGMWALETAFDASYADLSPGLLLPLLDMHAAIQRQEKFINLLNGFSDYKRHWKAEVIGVKNVQLIRRLSLHNLRGSVGDLIRNLRSSSRPAFPTSKTQPRKQKSGAPLDRSVIRPDRSQAQALTAQALAYDGPGIQRLDLARIRELLPFETRRCRSSDASPVKSHDPCTNH